MIKLPYDTMIEIYHEESEKYTIIEDKQVDSNRWSAIHELIFQDKETGKFYMADYSIGLTESQDESPWEDEDEVEITEVVKKEVITYKWVTK